MSYNATVLQAAQASQGALVRGWLASPALPAEAPVPDPGAQVDVAVMDLENKLHEVQLAAAPHVTTAAETPYTAARAAADAQFNLHMKNGCNCPPCSTERGACIVTSPRATPENGAIRHRR
ncbi:hypothetical protein EDD90_10943 [Streptomyces sp. Ag109_O5-1]|uniref:hypothetical protein n=1 Tax=Streptomyces sp. Ag109_O5-1 TaxID=1938851 RepID=UPI000F502CA5|nr:hypothetical protein [Streptomyces sp. Ag109_O5-1]RPE26653.1 hypothetical protein EDD90_10943 [Streptomyces sp. Ag109_O5-1]